MNMSNKRFEGKIQMKGWIPESLAREVKILLMDPRTAQTKYGSMSSLMAQLLEDWVDDKRVASK